jgi:superfamily II DNA/RNA helicase
MSDQLYTGSWWRSEITTEPNTTEEHKEVASSASPTEPSLVKSFDEMGLADDVLRGVYAYGFENPSRVQQQSIVPIIAGHDAIIQSQSGTGKTAAFAIALLQRLDYSLGNSNTNDTNLSASNKQQASVQVIVLTATRELATQLFRVIEALATYTPAKVQLIAGGTSVREDILGLRENAPHVVVGVGGRVYDLIQRHALDCTRVSMLVLDEADELLSSQKKSLAGDLVLALPTTAQIVLFASTLRREHVETACKAVKSPLIIRVKKRDLSLEGIRHAFLPCSLRLDEATGDERKLEALKSVWEYICHAHTIAFCTTKKVTEWVRQELLAADFTSSFFHGDLEQSQRTATLQEFRTGACSFLFSTDALARGLDVPSCGLIINYDLPLQAENSYDQYYLRAGRSGRFGRKGLVLNLVLRSDEMSFLEQVQRRYGFQLDEISLNNLRVLANLL